MAFLQRDVLDIYNDQKINFNLILKEYNIKLSNLQNTEYTIKQLANIKNINSIITDQMKSDYLITVEDTFEKLSIAVYNNPNYWWLIALINDIKNPFTFNCNSDQLTYMANWLYTNEGKYNVDIYFDLLHEFNEKNKRIIIINPTELSNYFRKLLEMLNA